MIWISTLASFGALFAFAAAPALLLPDEAGTVGAVIGLFGIAGLVFTNDDERFASGKDTRREFLSVLAFFVLLLLVNHSLS